MPNCWSGLCPKGMFYEEKIGSQDYIGEVKHLVLLEFAAPEIKQTQSNLCANTDDREVNKCLCSCRL